MKNLFILIALMVFISCDEEDDPCFSRDQKVTKCIDNKIDLDSNPAKLEIYRYECNGEFPHDRCYRDL